MTLLKYHFFYIFANRDAYLHTRACLPQFLVELHKIGWPLLLSSSFLELDYREETNHSEDYQTSLVPDPNMMPKLMTHHTTMSYRCSWLRLMVASAGEADRCSIKNGQSSIT